MPRKRPDNTLHHQRGLTLIELLLAMALGLIVTLAAISLLISSKAGYQSVDEMSRIEESGRFALDTIARAVRQTGFVNWSAEDAPFIVESKMSANIVGYDNSRLQQTSPGVTSPLTPGVNGSDVLGLRFFGSGTANKADGSILDCAGYAIAHPPSHEAAERDINGQGRGWSIFYVDLSEDGEPELRCKFQYQNTWSSIPVIRGVESFQVLYGIDKNNNGFPNSFLTATQINLMDDQTKRSSRDKNAHTWWKNIVSVKIALLVRGTQNSQSLPHVNHTYHLFGEAYTKIAGNQDKAAFGNNDFDANTRNRPRKVFETTIVLRNKTPPRID